MKCGNERKGERDIGDGSPSNRAQSISEFEAFGRQRMTESAVASMLPFVVNGRCVLIARQNTWMLVCFSSFSLRIMHFAVDKVLISFGFVLLFTLFISARVGLAANVAYPDRFLVRSQWVTLCVTRASLSLSPSK